jgi:hypothetical protein
MRGKAVILNTDVCIMYTKVSSREVIYEGLDAQYREFKVERPVVLL